MKYLPMWAGHDAYSDEPYERRVTRALFIALAALDDAARVAAADGNMEPFQAAVKSGVSANLWDAVLGLADAASKQSIDFRVVPKSARRR